MEKVFETILEKAKTYCRDKTDLVHMLTALEMARKLLPLEGGNKRIIIPAIIMHDLGWHLFSYQDELKARKITRQLEEVKLSHKHELESAALAEKILSELNYKEEEKKQIIEIITWHDTRTMAISREDMIVKDADRLSRYTPQCFDLFCHKFDKTQEEFFDFLKSQIEKGLFTDSARFLAREYLVKRRFGLPEVEVEEGLSSKFYEFLIKLEGQVVKIIRSHLEEIAIRTAKEKVYDVKKMIEQYLANRTYIDLKELQKDEEFCAIATQKVSIGGYIGVIDRETGRIIFHPDKRVINLAPPELKRTRRPPEYLHGFWDWHKRARAGEEFYSYYQGMNTRGEIIDKFQYVVPLDIRNARWALVAAAACDDFFKPIDILSKEIVGSVGEVSDEVSKLIRLVEERTRELTESNKQLQLEITERKQMEESLRESEERFRLVFENAKDAIFWADPETGLITNCNKAAEILLEKERTEIIGRPQTTVHPPQKAQYYAEMFKKHIESKGWVDDEAEVITKSGKILPVHITASATLIRERPIIQEIFHDITEHKKMRENFIKAEKLAATAQIAAEAAHEIKNPLHVVNTGLYYLKMITAKEDLKAQQTIQRMANALLRATDFINDLLHISRPLKLKTGEIDINELIKEAMDEVPKEILSNIKVNQKLTSDLPLIELDFDRIKEVMVNLITNAVEAMEEVKSKELRVESREEEGFVRISISDTGKGIPEEELDKIFDPFHTTKAKGIGLGLAICQRFVEAHHGRIDVKSEVGIGTTFMVWLPIYPVGMSPTSERTM